MKYEPKQRTSSAVCRGRSPGTDDGRLLKGGVVMEYLSKEEAKKKRDEQFAYEAAVLKFATSIIAIAAIIVSLLK